MSIIDFCSHRLFFTQSQKYFWRKLREMIELRRTFSRKRIDCRIESKNKIPFKLNHSRLLTPSLRGSKTNVDYGGTLLDQHCRFNNLIWFAFVQIKSRVSQTFSGKVKIFTRWVNTFLTHQQTSYFSRFSDNFKKWNLKSTAFYLWTTSDV